MSTIIRFIAVFFVFSSMLHGAGNPSTKSGEPAETNLTYLDIQKTLGHVPAFFKSFPVEGIEGAWEEMKAVQMNPSSALPPKYKELIGLAVSAQIPCRYCTYFHTEAAKLSGTSSAELAEAVALAAGVRHWSTFLNGLQLDMPEFRSEINQMIEIARKKMEPHASELGSAPKAAKLLEWDRLGTKAENPTVSITTLIRTPKEAYQDIEKTLGLVPQFFRMFPEEGIVGAWKEMKSVQMNPYSQIPAKYKELIGLAVSAQIPCTYCTYFHTKAAELNGATDRELREALAVASIVRRWSTVINGVQVDGVSFRKDVDRAIKFLKSKKPPTVGMYFAPPDHTTEVWRH